MIGIYKRFRRAKIPDDLTPPEYLQNLSCRIDHELQVINDGGKPSTTFTLDELLALKVKVPTVLENITFGEKRSIRITSDKEFNASTLRFRTHTCLTNNTYIKLAIALDHSEWIIYLSPKLNEFGI